MADEDQHKETARRAANLSLSGRRRKEARQLASIELRAGSSPQSKAWELAALLSVGLASFLVVLGLWFL